MVIPPPRFTLPASFSVGLSAWRWACALPRCGSRDFRISRRIPKTRTRPQSETDSDFVGLVRLTGVEPVRPFGHKHLKLASLPIPAQPHIEVPKDRSVIILSPAVFVNCFPRTERGVSGQARQSARGLRPGAPSKEAVQRRHAAAVSASPIPSTPRRLSARKKSCLPASSFCDMIFISRKRGRLSVVAHAGPQQVKVISNFSPPVKSNSGERNRLGARP